MVNKTGGNIREIRIEQTESVKQILVWAGIAKVLSEAGFWLTSKEVTINGVICRKTTELNPVLIGNKGIMIQVHGKDAVKVLPKE